MNTTTLNPNQKLVALALSKGWAHKAMIPVTMDNRTHRAKVLAAAERRACPECGRLVPLVNNRIIRHRVGANEKGASHRICNYREDGT